jgi:DnaK suppressor protein
LISTNKEKLLVEEKRLKGLISHVNKYEDLGNKEDDNALEVEQYAESVAEEHDLVGKLQRVQEALARVKSGKYGLCKIGGEEIAAERLKAVPEAENCVEHESQQK